jgi:membrane protease YdiL (CAAX protease family)
VNSLVSGNRKAWLFLLLTFSINWLMAGLYYLAGGRLSSPSAVLVLLLYMFVPMTSAIIVQRFVARQPIRDLGISFKFNRWFIIAWLLPVCLVFAAFGVSLLFPGVHYSPGLTAILERFRSLVPPERFHEMQKEFSALPFHPIWLLLLQGLFAGATLNAVAAFGEELGWRGLLQQALSPAGFWKSSFLIGAIWGIWHAPLVIQGYNYPGHPLPGVAMMVIWCMLLGPIFALIRIKAKSVVATSILHGTINGITNLAVMLVWGGNDLTTGLMGFPGLIVLIIVNLAIFFLYRNHERSAMS